MRPPIDRLSRARSSTGTSAAPRDLDRRPRISGIDCARFLALVGMMAAHVWSVNAGGSPEVIDGIVAGKAAAFFAVLAGVGISLTTRSDLAAGRSRSARWNLAGRGLALVLIGLTLGLVPGSIIVILVYYGVMFWVAVPLLRWSNRALLAGAGGLALVWPVLSSLLRSGLEQPFELGTANWLSIAEPAAFVRGLFVPGAYPVLTWIVYAMVGMVVGRLIMAATDDGALRRLGLRLALLGVVGACASWGVSALISGPVGGLAALGRERPDLAPELLRVLYFGTGMGSAPSGSLWWLTSPAPHTGTTLDLAITTSIALAGLGICLALGTLLSAGISRLLEPIRRAGSAPLTVYVSHVIAAAVVAMVAGTNASDSTTVPWYASSAILWGLHISGALVIGMTLMVLRRRGPLEALVSWSGRILSQRCARRKT